MKDDIPDDMLSAYFDGEATPAERALVERLLETSAAARQQLADFQCLSSWLQDLPREALPAEFSAQILQRAEREMLLSGETRAAAPLPLAVTPHHPAQVDSTNTVAANSDAANSDAANSDAANSDAANSDAANSDAANSEVGAIPAERVLLNGAAGYRDNGNFNLNGSSIPLGTLSNLVSPQKPVTSRQAGARWLASVAAMVASSAALILVCSQVWQSPTDSVRERSELARTVDGESNAPDGAALRGRSGYASTSATAPAGNAGVELAEAQPAASGMKRPEGDRSTSRGSVAQAASEREQLLADQRAQALPAPVARKQLTASERDREWRARNEGRVAGTSPSPELLAERAKFAQHTLDLAQADDTRRQPVLLKSLQDLSWFDLTAGQNVEALSHHDEGIAVVKVYVVDQNAGIHVVQTVLANNAIVPMEANGNPTSVAEFQRDYATQKRRAAKDHQLTAVYVEATSAQLANVFKELQTEKKMVVDVKVEDSLDPAQLSGESRQLVDQFALLHQDQDGLRSAAQDQAGLGGSRAKGEDAQRRGAANSLIAGNSLSTKSLATAPQATSPGEGGAAKKQDLLPLDAPTADGKLDPHPTPGLPSDKSSPAPGASAKNLAPEEKSAAERPVVGKPGDVKSEGPQKPAAQLAAGTPGQKSDGTKPAATLADAAAPSSAKAKGIVLKNTPADASVRDLKKSIEKGGATSANSAVAGGAGRSDPARENQTSDPQSDREGSLKEGGSTSLQQTRNSHRDEAGQPYRARQLYLNIPSEALSQRRVESDKLTASGPAPEAAKESETKSNQRGSIPGSPEKTTERSRTGPSATSTPPSLPSAATMAKSGDVPADSNQSKFGANRGGTLLVQKADALAHPPVPPASDKRLSPEGGINRSQAVPAPGYEHRDTSAPIQILLLIEQRSVNVGAPAAVPSSNPPPRR